MLVVGAVSALACAVAVADVRDAGAKIRGDYGDASQSRTRSRAVYQYGTPVAQAQAGERRFSYEPARADDGATAVQDNAKANRPDATAQGGSQGVRRYSYQPENAPSRTYYVPRRLSRIPAYELQKTDPRKFEAGR